MGRAKASRSPKLLCSAEIRSGAMRPIFRVHIHGEACPSPKLRLPLFSCISSEHQSDGPTLNRQEGGAFSSFSCQDGILARDGLTAMTVPQNACFVPPNRTPKKDR